MADKGPIPLAPPPGVCFSAANYAAGKDAAYISSGAAAFRTGEGRWSNAYNVESVAGFPQKIAGWVAGVQTALEGIPRCIKQWRDNSGNARAGIGTTTHLYSWQANVATDITPLQSISVGSLTNPISTQSGSTTVAIADSSQVLQNGDWVFLSAASAVGGVTLNGWYPVSSRTGTGYNVTVPVAASSTAGPGGGTTQFQYPRINLSSPFTTVQGSAIVTVAHTAHGQVTGNFVIYSGATAVGGLTIAGEYQLTVVNANSYTITASSPAASGVTDGGTVSTIYLIRVAQTIVTGNPNWGDPFAWGAAGTLWGTANQFNATLPDGWTLAPYGSQLLACPIGGTIYVVDTIFGGRAHPLLNAPAQINAIFVTPERFVIALGVGANPLNIQWPDQGDYTAWTPTAANTANSRTLQGGSYFVGGVGIINGTSLIFTDRCIFEMQYTGGQEVYATPQRGDNCGLASPWAVTAEGGIAWWMSDQDFWTWNGSAQATNSDDIRASIFQAAPTQKGLNRTSLAKSCAILNRAKKQIRFYYSSANAVENDSGMILQTDQQCWWPLAFGRSAGDDSRLLQSPISADSTGLVYLDEKGTDANGVSLPCYIELAQKDLSNGGRNLDILGFLPNFQTLVGTAVFNAGAAYYTSDTQQTDGPFQITAATERQDLRIDGNLFSFNLTLNALGATMRLGINRLDIQPSGARR